MLSETDCDEICLVSTRLATPSLQQIQSRRFVETSSCLSFLIFVYKAIKAAALRYFDLAIRSCFLDW
jgi:hypothetical protein